MDTIKAFHIINKGERKGALDIARAIKKDSGLKIGPGWYGEGAYAHYYNNVDKPLFKDKPMVIFSVEKKRVRHIKQSPFPFIVMKGKKDESMVTIDIIEFNRLLKNTHLLRCAHPSSLRRTLQYSTPHSS